MWIYCPHLGKKLNSRGEETRRKPQQLDQWRQQANLVAAEQNSTRVLHPNRSKTPWCQKLKPFFFIFPIRAGGVVRGRVGPRRRGSRLRERGRGKVKVSAHHRHPPQRRRSGSEQRRGRLWPTLSRQHRIRGGQQASARLVTVPIPAPVLVLEPVPAALRPPRPVVSLLLLIVLTHLSFCAAR